MKNKNQAAMPLNLGICGSTHRLVEICAGLKAKKEKKPGCTTGFLFYRFHQSRSPAVIFKFPQNAEQTGDQWSPLRYIC